MNKRYITFCVDPSSSQSYLHLESVFSFVDEFSIDKSMTESKRFFFLNVKKKICGCLNGFELKPFGRDAGSNSTLLKFF